MHWTLGRVCVAFVSVCMLLCVGCAGPGGGNSGTNGAEVQSVVPDKVKNEWVCRGVVAELPSQEVKPGHSLSGIRLGEERKVIEGIIGSPEGLDQSTDPDNATCVYPDYGMIVEYEDGRSVVVLGTGANDALGMTEYGGKTVEGIGMGSTRGMVIKTLGKSEVDLPDSVVYAHKGVFFGFVKGRVNTIGVSAPAETSKL